MRKISLFALIILQVFKYVSKSFVYMLFFIYTKGKEIPLQAWTDPAISRKLRLPVFKTIGS
jgi:hypothetical protein